MNSKLPPVHDIEIEIDGQTFAGSWYVILGEIIVNYNGHTSQCKPSDDAEGVAAMMLKDLVEKHYVKLDSLPAELPSSIRKAAHAVLNCFDDDQLKHDLIASFGESIPGSEVHRQLSWLCVNALGKVVPFWKSMCDGDTPERTYRDLRRWLEDPSSIVDWESSQVPCVPTAGGERVSDCDACRVEPISEAVAMAASYLKTADPSQAANVLLEVAAAYDEGCRPHAFHTTFDEWLVYDLLPFAYRCEPPGE